MNVSDFFRASYRRMVGYCSSFGYQRADVEEAVADVILRHFDDYAGRVEAADKEKAIRSWMNRRALLNLAGDHRQHRYTRTEAAAEYDEEAIQPDSQVSPDDPERILCLAQRLPKTVAPILFEYEPYGGDASLHGANSPAARVKFCRARQRFVQQLAA